MSNEDAQTTTMELNPEEVELIERERAKRKEAKRVREAKEHFRRTFKEDFPGARQATALERYLDQNPNTPLSAVIDMIHEFIPKEELLVMFVGKTLKESFPHICSMIQRGSEEQMRRVLGNPPAERACAHGNWTCEHPYC